MRLLLNALGDFGPILRRIRAPTGQQQRLSRGAQACRSIWSHVAARRERRPPVAPSPWRPMCRGTRRIRRGPVATRVAVGNPSQMHPANPCDNCADLLRLATRGFCHDIGLATVISGSRGLGHKVGQSNRNLIAHSTGFGRRNTLRTRSPTASSDVATRYLRPTALLTGRASAPTSTSAVAEKMGEPAGTLPRIEHGCNVTAGLLRMRFTLPESISVTSPPDPSGRPAIHTGVGTASPFLRNVVNNTYFSSVIATSERYPSSR